MTDPVFLAPFEVLRDASPGANLVVSGEEARHALRVRRMRVGEAIHLVDGQGRRVRGVIAATAAGDELTVDVAQVVDETEPSPRIVVVQALAKSDRGERAVEIMTEVGVDVIVPWAAARSVTSWSAERAIRGQQRWRATVTQAAKQSRRAHIPVIEDLVDLSGACRWVRDASSAFVLDCAGATVTALSPGVQDRDIVLVVGPEGGIEEEESTALIAAGARAVSLGPTVMRTSTAGAVAASLVLAASRWRESDTMTGFPS